MTDASGIISAQSNPEFRIGLIFRQSFEILGHGFWRYGVISLIPILPSLFSLLLSHERSLSAIWIGIFLQVVLGSVIQGAIVYGSFQDMRGRPFSLGAALGRCIARLWPILGTALLVSLIAGLGALLLVVPGFIAILMLYVAVPACVVEGLRPVASLSRSAELTKGFRWKILGLFLLVALISIICSSLVTFILTLSTGAFVAALGKFVVQALTAALSGILAAVIYYNLRVTKEGIDIDRIASVFD